MKSKLKDIWTNKSGARTSKPPKESFRYFVKSIAPRLSMENGKDGIDVFITQFYNPKRKWVFYPQALYDYNRDNIDNAKIRYTHVNQVPKYNIYESVFKNDKWQRVGKIGYCLPKTTESGSNYLFVPPNFRSDNARRKYYQLSRR